MPTHLHLHQKCVYMKMCFKANHGNNSSIFKKFILLLTGFPKFMLILIFQPPFLKSLYSLHTGIFSISSFMILYFYSALLVLTIFHNYQHFTHFSKYRLNVNAFAHFMNSPYLQSSPVQTRHRWSIFKI